MTLKGQKNHYNVMLLRGYGVSINLKNNKVVLKGGSDVFTGQYEQEEWFVTQIPYERIVVSGKGYISTEAIKLLAEKNINVILTDTYGNLVTAMHKVMSSPTAMNYRIGQYDTFRNPEKVAYLQKELLRSKLSSQIQFLKSLQKPEVQEAIDGLLRAVQRIDNAKDKRELLVQHMRTSVLSEMCLNVDLFSEVLIPMHEELCAEQPLITPIFASFGSRRALARWITRRGKQIQPQSPGH